MSPRFFKESHFAYALFARFFFLFLNYAYSTLYASYALNNQFGITTFQQLNTTQSVSLSRFGKRRRRKQICSRWLTTQTVRNSVGKENYFLNKGKKLGATAWYITPSIVTDGRTGYICSVRIGRQGSWRGSGVVVSGRGVENMAKAKVP